MSLTNCKTAWKSLQRVMNVCYDNDCLNYSDFGPLQAFLLSQYYEHMNHLLCGIESNDRCPICFEILQSPVSLPCDHVFCRQCIVAWIETETTCPICRQYL